MIKVRKYLVILYYKYVFIKEPQIFLNEHFELCKNLGLLGRVIIANEGINGTLSGKCENIKKYIAIMRKNNFFSDVDFKITKHTGHVFNKLSIKVKKEIVNFNTPEKINLLNIKGDYLMPKDFYNQLKDSNNLIIDARNNYEYQLGHFKNAINPNIKNFRDLPEWVFKNKNLFLNKKILTYCTGGIRCEKFSGFLKSQGFKEVYQLKGGIINYGKELKISEDLWEGKLYVFDKRIIVNINKQQHEIVSKDHFDNKPCERYINCANPHCNKQFFCSKKNEKKFSASCSEQCFMNIDNRYVLHQNNKDKI